MRGFLKTTTGGKVAKTLKGAAAALLCVTLISQPHFACAARGGGGGFHGGGFHGGGFHGGGFHGGGFHGGGFHGGGFHGGGFRAGGFHADAFHAGWLHAGGFHSGFAGLHNGSGRVNEGHWYHGWHGGRYGWWLIGPGLAWTYYSYPSWGDYPDYGYYDDYGQPSAWYYCSDPQGYYPYVTQCYTGWQTVPAS
jgi:hypothetical protein